jgi:glutathione S-transferase
LKKIKLYGYATSPFVMKVACYLYYKKLPFEHVPVNPISPVQIKFTEQRQVPVLTIDDEWRKDSSLLGSWLDERFPERPILGDSPVDREKILAVDNWISTQLIPAKFREVVKWENTWGSIRNGWKLSRAVSHGTPLPRIVRFLWPYFVRKAPFIIEMVSVFDDKESMCEMRQRMCEEFIGHLHGSHFLGGRQDISLADLSAYPIIVSSHLMGLHTTSPFLENDEVIAWCRRVQSALPHNPLLVPDQLVERDHL